MYFHRDGRLIGGVDDSEDFRRIVGSGMYVVGDDGIVVDAVAFFQDIGILAIVVIEDALEYLDVFFPFVCGEYEIHPVFSRSDIDQERFHMAARLVL